MSNNFHEIALIFDSEFGDKFRPISDHMHVWLVKSSANEAAFLAYSQRAVPDGDDEDDLSSGVTMFAKPKLDETLLETIWDHHGEYAHQPPLTRITVIGLEPNQQTLAMFGQYDFVFKKSVEGGFVVGSRD